MKNLYCKNSSSCWFPVKRAVFQNVESPESRQFDAVKQMDKITGRFVDQFKGLRDGRELTAEERAQLLATTPVELERLAVDDIKALEKSDAFKNASPVALAAIQEAERNDLLVIHLKQVEETTHRIDLETYKSRVKALDVEREELKAKWRVPGFESYDPKNGAALVILCNQYKNLLKRYNLLAAKVPQSLTARDMEDMENMEGYSLDITKKIPELEDEILLKFDNEVNEYYDHNADRILEPAHFLPSKNDQGIESVRPDGTVEFAGATFSPARIGFSVDRIEAPIGRLWQVAGVPVRTVDDYLDELTSSCEGITAALTLYNTEAPKFLADLKRDPLVSKTLRTTILDNFKTASALLRAEFKKVNAKIAAVKKQEAASLVTQADYERAADHFKSDVDEIMRVFAGSKKGPEDIARAKSDIQERWFEKIRKGNEKIYASFAVFALNKTYQAELDLVRDVAWRKIEAREVAVGNLAVHTVKENAPKLLPSEIGEIQEEYFKWYGTIQKSLPAEITPKQIDRLQARFVRWYQAQDQRNWDIVLACLRELRLPVVPEPPKGVRVAAAPKNTPRKKG